MYVFISCLPQETCKICFEPFPVPDMHCARCKHYYCKARRAGSSFNLCSLSREGCHWSCLTSPAAACDACPTLTSAGFVSPLQDCWRGYIQTAIDSGPSCLDLRCPDPGAPVVPAKDRHGMRAVCRSARALARPLLPHKHCCCVGVHATIISIMAPCLPTCRMCAPCANCLMLHFMPAECKAAVPRSVVFSVADAPHRQR